MFCCHSIIWITRAPSGAWCSLLFVGRSSQGALEENRSGPRCTSRGVVVLWLILGGYRGVGLLLGGYHWRHRWLKIEGRSWFGAETAFQLWKSRSLHVESQLLLS